MRVTMVGSGYVGLTTGAALAYIGHHVTCIDTNQEKVLRLQAGEVPIYEPGLPELLSFVRERIRFTTSYRDAVPDADVIFIAVGTPPRANGEADLSSVRAAAQSIGHCLDSRIPVIVTKSTVPIGSGNWVDFLVREAREACNGKGAKGGALMIASNPEFLREGSALYDALYPDRIVIGTDDERAASILVDLYRPLLDQTFTPPSFLDRPSDLGAVSLLVTDLASAELIKYAANAFLALKISFINEIGTLAERVGADIVEVAKGIGLDHRIGNRFLQAGVGWGGSCFGKDTAALLSTGREYGLEMPIIKAAREVNLSQRKRVVEKLQEELKILKGRVIALLGLSFKPNTDDLRDSPAIDIAKFLVARGAKVCVHDPVALANAKASEKDLAVVYCENYVDAVRESDAVVLTTDWPEYRELPWEEVIKFVRQPLVLDCRNFLDPERLVKLGFRYIGMGRGKHTQLRAAVTATQKASVF